MLTVVNQSSKDTSELRQGIVGNTVGAIGIITLIHDAL